MFNKWLGKVFDGPCHPKGELGSGVIAKLPLPTAESGRPTCGSPFACRDMHTEKDHVPECCSHRKWIQSALNLVKKAFHSKSIWVYAHSTLNDSECDVEKQNFRIRARKKRVFNLNDYKPQSSLWMILKPSFSSHTPTPESCFWHCGSCGNCLITLRTRSFSRACSDWFSTYLYTGEYCPSFYVNFLKSQYCPSIHASINLSDTFYTIHPIRRQIS